MASSQVEIATSSPFGCRDSCYQNNINSHQIDLTDLWVHQPQWQSPTTTNVDDSNYRPSIDYRPKNSWARAREIVFPGDRKQPAEVSNSGGGGVSSLLQKWRGFEAKVATNKTSPANAQDNADPPLPPPADDDSIGDWESDRTVVSGRSSCPGRDSDFTESERLRVADIIRRLTTEDGPYSPPRVRTSWDHQSDQQQRSSISPVVGSPRIRGRQAYIDLLTQMERDRRNELERLVGRKAVSQFSHRGRIQALLRIKFLRRGLGAIEGRFSNGGTSKPPLQATHLRERVNSIAAKKTIDKAPNGEDVDNQLKEDECHQDSETSTTSKGDDIPHTSPETNTIYVQQNAEVLHSYPNKPSPFSKFIRQDSNIDHSLAKFAEADSEQNKEDQCINHRVTETNYETTSDFANPQSYQEEEEQQQQQEEEEGEEEEEDESNDNQQATESDAYWVSDASHPEAEVESDYHEEGVSRGDWIGEVSRPRSDWEDMRQARYQEMLDPFLDNQEIRALLDRKSVSGFLSSGMREKIDQVMMFRCQTVKTNLQAQEEKHEERLPKQEDTVAVVVSEEGEEVVRDGGYGDYFDEFEEAESSLGGQQYNESEYMFQTPAWPQNQGRESSIYSYQVESTPPASTGPNSSYGVHPTIEMEVIYDLRRHMEQLHQEMSELRKSIKCCTDMQLKLQRSIKKEVTTALAQPAPDHTMNGRRNPIKKGATGGRCCVCRKVQVDCLLYRCGHMCTCFKCAHELQWSSGKCPVCRARIVDVVRTYTNY